MTTDVGQRTLRSEAPWRDNLFRANRRTCSRPTARWRHAPQITSFPPQVHHGHEIRIQKPSPSTIAKMVLVRPMAVTHQTDSEQRVLQLSFLLSEPTEGTATAPNGWHPHALAPRGWSMVFLVDTRGVPSMGQFMHLH